MKYKEKLKGHTKTVIDHKKEVYKCMKQCGHPIQGLLHDMSKFSPIEFFESVKYFTGTRSPIENAKEVKGYSDAWLHHKGKISIILSIGLIILGEKLHHKKSHGNIYLNLFVMVLALVRYMLKIVESSGHRKLH